MKTEIEINDKYSIFIENNELLISKLVFNDDPFDYNFGNFFLNVVGTTKDTKNVFKVFKVLSNEIVKLIKDNNLKYFWFSCANDRILIYSKYIKKICEIIDFDFIFYNGRCDCYKRKIRYK